MRKQIALPVAEAPEAAEAPQTAEAAVE
jgi:hypothetical protein